MNRDSLLCAAEIYVSAGFFADKMKIRGSIGIAS